LNELAPNIVAYCEGLQLALDVIGSVLCHKRMEEWYPVKTFSRIRIQNFYKETNINFVIFLLYKFYDRIKLS